MSNQALEACFGLSSLTDEQLEALKNRTVKHEQKNEVITTSQVSEPKGFRGELGARLEKVIISKPYNGTHDLTLKSVDGAFLHITGDNDIVKLLEQALSEYKNIWEAKGNE